MCIKFRKIDKVHQKFKFFNYHTFTLCDMCGKFSRWRFIKYEKCYITYIIYRWMDRRMERQRGWNEYIPTSTSVDRRYKTKSQIICSSSSLSNVNFKHESSLNQINILSIPTICIFWREFWLDVYPRYVRCGLVTCDTLSVNVFGRSVRTQHIRKWLRCWSICLEWI